MKEREMDPEFLQAKYGVNRWKDFKEKRLDAMKSYICMKRNL